MHGNTHAYPGTANPYGVSAEDFEFYRAHVDPAGTVVLDGPVPGDSVSWVEDRIADARAEWARVGLPPATIFDHSRFASQFFPYPVTDVYGAHVIPETLGNVATQGFNQHETRMPDQILASARRQLVVRDGVASFFYHPFLGLQYLPTLVEGIQSLGYTFVSAQSQIPR